MTCVLGLVSRLDVRNRDLLHGVQTSFAKVHTEWLIYHFRSYWRSALTTFYDFGLIRFIRLSGLISSFFVQVLIDSVFNFIYDKCCGLMH